MDEILYVVGGDTGVGSPAVEKFGEVGSAEAPGEAWRAAEVVADDTRFPSKGFSIFGTDFPSLEKQILESQDLVTRPQMLVGTILPFQQLDGTLVKDGKV